MSGILYTSWKDALGGVHSDEAVATFKDGKVFAAVSGFFGATANGDLIGEYEDKYIYDVVNGSRSHLIAICENGDIYGVSSGLLGGYTTTSKVGYCGSGKITSYGGFMCYNECVGKYSGDTDGAAAAAALVLFKLKSDVEATKVSFKKNTFEPEDKKSPEYDINTKDEENTNAKYSSYSIINPKESTEINVLKSYANLGDATAMQGLGLRYFWGEEGGYDDVIKDLEQAKYWLNKFVSVAENGNIIGQFEIASGNYFSSSYLASVRTVDKLNELKQIFKNNIRQKSLEGNPDAIYANTTLELGEPEFGGQQQFVKSEWKEAAIIAAKKGSSWACYKLYHILSYNYTPTSESIEFLKMGAQAENTFGARCLVDLSYIYKDLNDQKSLLDCIKKATNLGSYEAQSWLGKIKKDTTTSPSSKSTSLSSKSTSTKSGGCYVATAVYGSYDCPQVWTLRRYRDYTLSKTWYGRILVHLYYALSPTIVRWFGNTEWFKKLCKDKLDIIVKKLNDDGLEDTPYQDINW